MIDEWRLVRDRSARKIPRGVRREKSARKFHAEFAERNVTQSAQRVREMHLLCGLCALPLRSLREKREENSTRSAQREEHAEDAES